MKGSGRQAGREPDHKQKRSDHKHPAWETNEKKWETNERKWETSRPGLGDKSKGVGSGLGDK